MNHGETHGTLGVSASGRSCAGVNCRNPPNDRPVRTRRGDTWHLCSPCTRILRDAGELLADDEPFIPRALVVLDRPVRRPPFTAEIVRRTPSIGDPMPVSHPPFVINPDATPGFCRIIGCDHKTKARGLCSTAYDTARESGLLEEYGLPPANAKTIRPAVTPATPREMLVAKEAALASGIRADEDARHPAHALLDEAKIPRGPLGERVALLIADRVGLRVELSAMERGRDEAIARAEAHAESGSREVAAVMVERDEARAQLDLEREQHGHTRGALAARMDAEPVWTAAEILRRAKLLTLAESSANAAIDLDRRAETANRDAARHRDAAATYREQALGPLPKPDDCPF